MIVTIHQPEHLPWLGFFAKMAAADRFVSLDGVPFRKNYFQNRNRILGHGGAPQWLTVPVRLDDHLESTIADVQIAGGERWRRKYVRTLRQLYARHPHGSAVVDSVIEDVEQGHARIAELNHALIETLKRSLEISTPVVRASDLGVQGSRSELLARLCERLGADVYLSGPSGRDYLDEAPFRERRIEVRVHDYEHPSYPQRGTDSFVSHLSVVDLLCNQGASSGETLRRGSRITRWPS